MSKSRLPLPERIFVSRPLPAAIILGDGQAIAGPFCVNCGNPASVHRAKDDACPVRRLHPLFPSGRRERCSCRLQKDPPDSVNRHDPDCNRRRYGFNETVTR